MSDRRSTERPLPLVGISACLLGQLTRYDGGSALEPLIAKGIGPHVRWLALCPEVGCGLPVPREPMFLVGSVETPRLVTKSTKIDHTQRLLQWMDNTLEEIEQMGGVRAFIFKSKSPSCGLAGIMLHDENGAETGESCAGLFAQAFMERFAGVPVADSAGLASDALLVDEFLARIRKPK